MRGRRVAASWLLVGAAACSARGAPSGTGDSGLPLDVLLPPSYASNPNQVWPAILFLHGAGGPRDYLTEFQETLGAHPEWEFLVLMPKTDGRWSTAALEVVLRSAVQRYRVDPDRVYLTGLSDGANAALNLAAARPREFAAIVLIAGYGGREVACKLRRVPIWLIHNRGDPVIPYLHSVSLAEAVRQCGGRVELTLRDSVPRNLHPHNAWTVTYRSVEFYTWLLQHTRRPPP